jgi:hypothetical protein
MDLCRPVNSGVRFLSVERVMMGKRFDWLKFVVRHKRPKGQLLTFFAFEVYYQLCTLRGYRPRHLLDQMPEEVRVRSVGQHILSIWPRRLPLSVRVLNRIFPFGSYHVEMVPYTPEAVAAAWAAGKRAEVMKTAQGELRLIGSSK